MRQLLALLPLVSLAACATMSNGSEQIISVTSDPPGAACVVDRLGAPPGEHMDEIVSTPDTVLVRRSDSKLKITCALHGYPTTQALQPPGLDYYGGLNVFNGVVIGTAIDASSGALFRYPNTVNVRLRNAPPPPPTAPVGGPSAAPVAAPRVAVAPTPLAPPPTTPAPVTAAPAPSTKP